MYMVRSAHLSSSSIFHGRKRLVSSHSMRWDVMSSWLSLETRSREKSSLLFHHGLPKVGLRSAVLDETQHGCTNSRRRSGMQELTSGCVHQDVSPVVQ